MNLYHDLATGRAVTGILHLVNQTPVDWYTKRQPSVEMATYGSELMVARMATEQIIGIQLTLHYLGVQIKIATYLFGDNNVIVDNSIFPKSKLHKHHQMVSYHHIREAIAKRFTLFIFQVHPTQPIF